MKNIKENLLCVGNLQLIFSLLIFLTFISCSGDGTDTDDSTSSTLLHSLSKSAWELLEDDNEWSYYRFHENISNPMEEWYKNGEDCYSHSFRAEEDDIVILENSISKFSIKATNSDNRQVILKFSKADDKIRVDIDKGDQLTVYFSKTSVNVDGLKICN